MLKYYLHSILQRELFPVEECPTMKDCNNDMVVNRVPAKDLFMGEAAGEAFDG